MADVVQFIPQLKRALRLRGNREAIGALSVATWSIATAQSVAWIVYGFAERLLPIAVPNLFIAPVCASILVIRLRHRS